MIKGVVYGNCQIFPIAYMLSVAFNNVAHFQPVQNFGADASLPPAVPAETQTTLQILIAQSGSWRSWRDVFDKIDPSATVVLIPPIGLNSLWPLACRDPRIGKASALLNGNAFPAEYTDSLALELMRDHADDRDDMFAERYYSHDVLSRFDVQRLAELDFDRMASLDEKSDVRVSGFVAENWTNKPLFWLVNHPTRPLICHIVEQIVARLQPALGKSSCQAALDCLSGDPSINEYDHFLTMQAPIHPAVARSLGLQYGAEGHKYRLFENLTSDHAQFISMYPDI